MQYTNTEKWNLLHLMDQLDTNYFGLTNDQRHVEAGRMAEGRNLIEQTVSYDATAACTFLDLLNRRDDAIRFNDSYTYHHAGEAANLLRSIHPQLPADELHQLPEPYHHAQTHDADDLPF